MKHDVGGSHGAPQDIDFIVVVRMGTEIRTLARKHYGQMHMHEGGGRRMIQVFRVNMAKRRLQESPQEREHTQTEATGSHGFYLRYHWERYTLDTPVAASTAGLIPIRSHRRPL